MTSHGADPPSENSATTIRVRLFFAHVKAIEGPDAMAGCRYNIKQDATRVHVIFLYNISLYTLISDPYLRLSNICMPDKTIITR
jgi:hypothetical protein